MSGHILFVSGLGRCGTTMVMHMLDKGGIPVAGHAPSYEDIPLKPSSTDVPWLMAQGGRAVKWLDPTCTFLPQARLGPVIWLDRDPAQQAGSQIKMARLSDPSLSENRKTRRAMERALRLDRERALRTVSSRALGDVTFLRFEDIIADPIAAAKKLAIATRGFGTLDVMAAARQVLVRSPRCAPDLAIEHMLIVQAGYDREAIR